MKQSPLFPGLACLLANAAALHTLFILLVFSNERQDDFLGMLLWWGFLVFTYGVLALFLRRPRSFRGVILLLLAGGLAQALAVWAAGVRYPSLMAGVCLALMWGGTYARCYEVLIRPPSAEKLITAFETTTLTLFAAGLWVAGGGAEPRALLPAAAGVLLTLGALAHRRGSNLRVHGGASKGWGGRLLPALLLAGLGGAAALFAAFLTGSAAQALTQFTTWLKGVGLAFLGALDRFVNWLAARFPVRDDGELEAVGPALLPVGGGENYMPGVDAVPYLVAGAVLLGGVLLIGWFLYKGGFSLRAPVSAPRGRVVGKGRGPAGHLRRFLLRLYRRFRFWLAYLARRNTGPGVLIWLERRLRRTRIRRGKGETCRSFLARARETLPGCREPLDELADCLDRLYFGGGGDLSAQRAARLRRCFRRALRGQAPEKS